VEIILSEFNGKKRPTGCKLFFKSVKATKYIIKNNSTERDVKRFYIDHTADPSHNGYVITTKDKCVKDVMGFGRFEFSIKKGEELTFVIYEQATFQTSFTSTSEIINLIKSRSDEPIFKDKMDILKAIVRRAETLAALQVVIGENYSERDLIKWKQGTTVDPEGKPLIGGTLIEQIEKIFGSKQLIETCTRTITSLEDQIKKVFTNQNRIRENLKSMDKMQNSPLVSKYLKDLEKEEDDIKAIRAEIDKSEKDKNTYLAESKNLKLAAGLTASKMKDELEVL